VPCGQKVEIRQHHNNSSQWSTLVAHASTSGRQDLSSRLQMPAPACPSVPHVNSHPSDGNHNPPAVCSLWMPVIWPHRRQELWASVHEVSWLLAHQCGTVCCWSSRTRHWPLDISSASWRWRCLRRVTKHQCSHHNFLLQDFGHTNIPLLNWTELN